MLGLKLETDPVWVKNVIGNNISEILTDHAWCEQKAATNAITLVVQYAELEDLVTTMIELAREEMSHFQMVHEIIKKRGHTLGPERKDDYVGQLSRFAKKGGGKMPGLLDKLLFAAMIEARSCERFSVLSENINDKELSEFYYDLMASEARHYTTFIKLAKKYFDADVVDARWQEWLVFEADLIRNYGKTDRIHG
jgi:tRNA 2-(methylsulfanyl)-N6-isopentenyladenosine37 hydroxylase